MDMIALRTFGGEIPLSPPHLLPENAAQRADFCDFAHGHLQPLKQGFLLSTMSNAVKTIYTEDGVLYYTWPVETYALKSPVLKDPYNRVYYLDAGVLKATTTAGMSVTGGVPALGYQVGVPRPTLAPTLTLADLTAYPDYPGATFAVKTWWESGAKRFQETAGALTTVTALSSYTFVAPALDTTNTPVGALLRATFTALSAAGKSFMSATLTAGDTDVRSSSLPGGVTFSMLLTTGTTYRIDLAYGIAETRAYTYTNVNTWLEESPPSPAAQVSPTYLQAVSVTLGVSVFTGFRPFSVYRTYRTIGASPSYLLVHEGTETTYTDLSHKASDVTGSLDTVDYEAPPPLLDAMVRTAGGSFVGFKGSTLFVSEPFRPHTWQYQATFPKNIRGVVAASQALIVTTAEGCYVVLGSHPSALQLLRLPVPQAGIAQRSMADLDGVTVFASNDGIVGVTGAQASLRQSQELFVRDDWQARYGSILSDASMRFAWHDGRLVATSANAALGFVLSLDEGGARQYTRFDEQMDAMFQLPVADSLYFSKGANIYQFRAGSAYTYTWWSRDFIFTQPRNLGAGYIRCSAPVTMTLYMDGVQWWTGAVSSGYFRLPAGRTALRWSVKLQGAATVEELYIARTMQELKRV